MRGERVTLKCGYCGNEVVRRKSTLTRNPQHVFCDIDCKRNYYKAEKLRRVCKTCGKEFEIYKSVIEKSNASGNFCCRKCYDRYQTTITGEKHHRYTCEVVPCKVCGKEVQANQYRLKTNQNIFCSSECYHKYFHNYVEGEKNAQWKGGYSPYRADFEKVKKKHFKGIQFCAMCGTTKGINIHHIIPYRLTQDNSLNNLIPLCMSHHKKVEHITMPIFEGYEDKEMAKSVLNALLRPKQKQVQMAVCKYIRERKNENAD